MDNREQKPKDYMFYAGYGFQLLGGVAVGIWLGRWLDKKCSFQTPLLIWILPLLVLIALLYELVKEFSNKRR